MHRKIVVGMAEFHAFQADERCHDAAAVRYAALAMVDAYRCCGHDVAKAISRAARQMRVSEQSIKRWLRRVEGISRLPVQDRLKALIFEPEDRLARGEGCLDAR